jgi:hypothetical protein
MAHLQALELSTRGYYEGVITLRENGQPTMTAFVLMDCERRFFSNTSSLEAVSPCTRTSWRQIAPVESNAPPVRMALTFPHAKTDRHNRSLKTICSLNESLGSTIGHFVVTSRFSRCIVSIRGLAGNDSVLAKRARQRMCSMSTWPKN